MHQPATGHSYDPSRTAATLQQQQRAHRRLRLPEHLACCCSLLSPAFNHARACALRVLVAVLRPLEAVLLLPSIWRDGAPFASGSLLDGLLRDPAGCCCLACLMRARPAGWQSPRPPRARGAGVRAWRLAASELFSAQLFDGAASYEGHLQKASDG